MKWNFVRFVARALLTESAGHRMPCEFSSVRIFLLSFLDTTLYPFPLSVASDLKLPGSETPYSMLVSNMV
jgi:hypothetical protein